MIIVEGLDNTGKTTLVEALVKSFPKLQRQPKFVGPEGPKANDSMWLRVQHYLLMTPLETGLMIFDRFPFISEQVYGPVIRGYSQFAPQQVKRAQLILGLHKPLIIYCHRSIQDIIGTLGDRQQMEGVRENLPLLLKMYNQVIQELGFDKSKYNFDQPETVSCVFDKVARYIGRFN